MLTPIVNTKRCGMNLKALFFFFFKESHLWGKGWFLKRVGSVWGAYGHPVEGVHQALRYSCSVF